jgi:hypothetical protein
VAFRVRLVLVIKGDLTGYELTAKKSLIARFFKDLIRFPIRFPD